MTERIMAIRPDSGGEKQTQFEAKGKGKNTEYRSQETEEQVSRLGYKFEKTKPIWELLESAQTSYHEGIT